MFTNTSSFQVHQLVVYHNTTTNLATQWRQNRNIRCEWLWPWNFRFHGNNTIHDISPPSVLLAFCICLIPIFVKIFIIFIAYHLRILRELLSLYFIMLEMTSVKTFYNQIPLRMHCSVFKECVSVLSFGFWVYSENISLHLFIPNKDICWSLLLSGAFHYFVWNVEAIKNSTEGHYVHNSRSTMMINRPGEYGVLCLCHIVQTLYRCCIFTTHLPLYYWTKQSAMYHSQYHDSYKGQALFQRQKEICRSWIIQVFQINQKVQQAASA